MPPPQDPPSREDYADELPHSAASDPILDIGARTPGPGSKAKLAFAVIAILLLAALMLAVLALGRLTHRPQPAPPPNPIFAHQPRAASR